MSKTKKIISMVLVAVLVMSACPFGLGALTTTVASAANDRVTWSASAPTGVSAVVTGTDVIRVAAGRFSYLNGTTIVNATDAGVPEGSAQQTYSGKPYDGKRPYAPTVTLTLGAHPDATPTVEVSGEQTTSINLGSPTIAGNSYTWTYPTADTTNPPTANAGDKLTYKFTYKIEGTTYTTYGAANVQEIASPAGSAMNAIRNTASTDGGNGGTYYSRFGIAFNVRAKGLYGRIGYESGNHGWQFQSSGATHVQMNYNVSTISRTPQASDTAMFISNGTSGANHVSIWHPEDNTYTNSSWTTSGYADDQNRSRADIFIDRSVTSSAADMDFTASFITVDGTNASNQQSPTVHLKNIQTVLNGSDSANVNEVTSLDSGSNPSAARFDMNIGHAGNFVDNSLGIGQYSYWPMTGDVFTSSPASNVATTSRGPQRLSIAYGIEGIRDTSRPIRVVSSFDFYFYVTDKADLRGLIKVIQGAQSSYTIANAPGTLGRSGTVTATKGANPQPAFFTTATYNAFQTAYVAACKELANGKSNNQEAIDTCFKNLQDAYNALQPVSYTVTAKLVLNGTTTPVPGADSIADKTYTATAGSAVTATAPQITGYTLKTDASRTVTVTGANEIVFGYEKEKYTYHFDPLQVDAGSARDGQRQVEYGETVTPESIAPTFTYLGYVITGWYSDSALTNRVTSFTGAPGTDAQHTFYAKWDVAPVTIKYNLGTTGATIADAQGYPNDSLSGFKPADPDILGYGFQGWFKDAAYVTPFDWSAKIPDIDSTSYTSTITAYAKFESYEGFIKFNSNGADSEVANIDLSTYNAGDTVTLPQPTRLGYTFDGWYDHSDFSGGHYTDSITLAGSLKTTGIMLYAKWSAKSITLDFNLKYNASTASPIDTSTNPRSITGYIGASIPGTVEDSNGAYVMPPHPVKYGYKFMGWTSSSQSNRQIFQTENAYNSAVNNGYRYDVEEANAVFQATTATNVTLYPMWVAVNTAAYIDVDTYKMEYGEAVSTDDTTISTGDIITVRMTPHTNFYTGSSVFVYMYDNNFFELIGSGDDAFTLNEDCSYIEAVSANDYSGYTASNSAMVPDGVAYPAGTAAADYNWIQVAIDPDVAGGNVYPGAMDDDWVVEFKLRVKATTPGDEGVVFMDNAWTRTPDNNGGTMFFGWNTSASEYVWLSHNNWVTPDLSLATSTVVLEADDSVDTTITADPDGGVWPDDATGTKQFSGDAGEEILGYGEPTREGYTLIGWANAEDSTDEWISGYYGSAEQNGKTYKAQWEGMTVTNNFDYNDGTGTVVTADSEYGSDIVTPASPSKTGYSFAGWATTADATEAEDLGTQNSETPTTFYGVWVPASDTQYKVVVQYVNLQTSAVMSREFTVAATGGKQYIGTTGATVHLVAPADVQTDTATDVYLSYADLPTIANYVFNPADANNVTTCTIKADGTGTLIVNYIGKYVVTTFNANNGTFNVPSPAQDLDLSRSDAYAMEEAYFGEGWKYNSATEYVFGSQFLTPIVLPVQPTRTGYDFQGWGTSATGSATTNVTNANNSRTLYAVWKGITVSNIFNADGGTFGTETTQTVDSVFGANIAAPRTAPTRAGYEFKGWATTSGQSTGTTSLGTQSATEPTTYYAAWELTSQQYNINVYYMKADGTYGTAADRTATGEGIGSVTVDFAPYAQTGFTFDAAASEITKTLDAATAGTNVTFIIKFARNTYTLTFSDGVDAANNVVINDVYYDSDIAGKAPTFTREGYTFNGWDAAVSKMPAANTTYTAQWTINSHTLRFVVNSEDFVDPQTVDYAASIIAPAGTPDVTGYTFTGWNTDSTAASGSTGTLGTMPDSDVTYYAILVKQQHNAIFYAESGDTDAFATVAYYYQDQVAAPDPAPTKYGYTFQGWTPALAVMGTEDQTYTGTWAAKTVTNTFDANNGAWGADTTKTVDSTFDAAVAAPAANPERAGYTFLGWATAADATTGTDNLGTQATETPATYYAVWAAKNNNFYTINIHKQNTAGSYDDSVVLNTTNVYYDGVTDEVKTIIPETITGFTFDDVNSVVSRTLAVDTDGSVNVFDLYYTRNQYTVTVDDDGATSTSNVYYGANVATPTEAGKTGYTFNGWKWFNGDTEITKPATMPEYNIKAVAQYTINQYTVTFNANTGAWGADTTKTATGDYNTAVAAPTDDPAKTGYTFAGWAESADAAAAAATLGNYPANNDKVFYAVYTPNTYNVVFNANTGAWGADTTKTVATVFDTAIEAPAENPTKTGYTFAGWAATADAASASALGNLTTAGDNAVTFYAVWTADTHTYNVNVYTMNADGTYNAAADDVIELDGVVDTTVNYTPAPATGFAVDTAKANVLTGTVPASGTLELVVYYAREQHTVTYGGRTNLGTFTDAAAYKTADDPARVDTYYYGQTVVPATIERTGYTASWVGTIPSEMGLEDVTVTVRWTANSYLVDFDANTGAWADSDTVKAVSSTFDSAIALPATNPEKAGYTFAGWAATADAAAGSTDLGNLTTAGDDAVKFYAVYTVNTYTATFNGNGGTWGTDAEATTDADFGAAITAPATNPERTGYTFVGWAETDDATAKLDSLGNMPVDGKTFYAVWSVNNYTLTYYVDGEVYGTPASIDFGTAITPEAAPTKYGYTFSGWSAIPATMPAEDVDVTGTFTAKTVTNSFDANEGEWADAAVKTVDSTFDADIAVPADPERAGYTFKGWAAAADATDAADLGTQATETPATYYAVWAADEHEYKVSIYYMGLNGRYAAIADEQKTFTEFVDATAAYTPETVTGFTLDTANSTLTGTVPATGTLELVVKYTRNQNDIIYKVDGEDYSTVSDVYYGETISAIAAPTKEGYTFSGWSTMPETMPDEDVTVTGTFSINDYALTVNYTGAGDATPEAHTEDVTYGTTYTVNTPAITGYTADIAVVTGTMPAEAVTVLVTYTANDYTLTVNYTGAGTATPAAHSEQVTYGTTYTVNTPAITGYTADVEVVTGTMPAEAVTVLVTYTANKYTLTVNYSGAGDATPEAYTEQVAFGTDYTVTTPDVTGYTANKAAVTGTMPAENVTAEVVYTINSYTLTFVAPKLLADGTLTTVDLSDASTYDIVSKDDSVDYNSAITAPTAPSIANYNFESWTGIAANMPASNLTVIASYSRVAVSLAIEDGSTTVIDKRTDDATFTGYIYGLAERLKVDTFKSDYVKVVGNGHIEVTPAYNYRQFNIVGTGTRVDLYDDVTNTIVETYYVVIFGDLNGDGYCSATDVSMVSDEVAAIESLSIFDGATETYWSVDEDGILDLDPDAVAAPQLLAADLNHDGFISSTDTSVIMNLASWAAEVDQTTGIVTSY